MLLSKEPWRRLRGKRQASNFTATPDISAAIDEKAYMSHRKNFPFSKHSMDPLRLFL